MRKKEQNINEAFFSSVHKTLERRSTQNIRVVVNKEERTK
jgi:hypothetical protein